MSMPFDGHPRLGDYMAWAQKQGCTASSGYTQTADGHVERLTRIVTSDGKRWVIEVGTDQREFLNSTTIARFDRRLALKSPWFSIDDSAYESSVKEESPG